MTSTNASQPLAAEAEVIHVGYPECDREAWADLWQCYEIVGMDRDYPSNAQAGQRLASSRASCREVSTFFTGLCRRERFCEGLVTEAIESGRLLAMVERLEVLLAQRLGGKQQFAVNLDAAAVIAWPGPRVAV